MVVHCLILSRLDTLQLKRDRLDGPLMTRMMFSLCKGREISRNSHKSRHMNCHQSCKIIHSEFPPRALWYVMRQEGLLGYLRPFDAFLASAWCNLLCPHRFLSSTYVVLHFPVPCLLRDGLRVDGLDTPLEVPPV